MTTSGTASFTLDIAEICEEAAELRTGYDLRTARRSLNLLTIELTNRGINMWTIEEGSVVLVPGQSTYDIPADTIDLMDMVIRTGTNQNQSDINISRIAEPTYATIPNKNSQGRPIQVWIQRLRDNPKITVWPIPDQSQSYTFVYWRLRRIQDAGSGGTKTMDIPFRFLNCIVAGLTYYLSMKIASVDPGRRAELKMDYEQQLDLASSEDREKAPIRLVPRIGR